MAGSAVWSWRQKEILVTLALSYFFSLDFKFNFYFILEFI